jgi:hypothetical protein
LFNASSMKAYARAMKKGFAPGSTQGDGKQNGGMFLVSGDLKMLFSHIDHFAGDLPDFDELIKLF